MWHAYGLIGDVPQSRVNQKDQKAKRVEFDTMSRIQDSMLRAETSQTLVNYVVHASERWQK